MRIQRLCVLGIFGLLAIPAAGADFTGTWETRIETDGGSVPTVFEFVVDGEELTGTFSNSFIPPIPLQEGVVMGDEISFKVRLQSLTLGYEGVVDGDELTLTSKVVEGGPNPRAEMTFTVTRTK